MLEAHNPKNRYKNRRHTCMSDVEGSTILLQEVIVK
nr:MAG TPA: hypothetical protein [Bacteriophage sp.]